METMSVDRSETDSELASVMSDHVRSLHEARSVDDTLQGITQAAVDCIPGADWAGITMVADRQLESRAPTSPVVVRIDVEQYETGEGPCLSALWEDVLVRADDIAADTRWPAWAANVQGLGVGSMLSFKLFVRGDVLGALNTYAASPHSYGPDAESVGLLFAAHAAVALSSAEEVDQLRRAASSRDLIGQAKGILMERYDLTSDDEAFDLMVRASQSSHVKLHLVARQLVERRQEFRPE
jgi:GAF domain-containing protein